VVGILFAEVGCLSLYSPFPLLSLPFSSGSLNPVKGVCGSAVSSQAVWAKPDCQTLHGAFWAENHAFGDTESTRLNRPTVTNAVFLSLAQLRYLNRQPEKRDSQTKCKTSNFFFFYHKRLRVWHPTRRSISTKTWSGDSTHPISSLDPISSLAARGHRFYVR